MVEYYNYTDAELKELLKSMIIVIDTKEKVNNHITDYFDKKSIRYINKSLNFADYTAIIPRNEKLGIVRDLYFNNIVSIERKASLVELSGNFTKDRTRIEHEFSRSKGEVTLLIEGDGMKDIITHNYTTQYAPPSFIATLLSFESRYNIKTKFITKEYSGLMIYQILYYAVREYLKRGV